MNRGFARVFIPLTPMILRRKAVVQHTSLAASEVAALRATS